MKKIKTVFVSGNFNIVHPGHIRLFQFAKEVGDRLIVGIHSDLIAGSHAHINERLRLEGVRNNSLIDETFLIEESVISAIRRLQPDIVLKGKEHEGLENPEKSIVENYGGKLIFSSGETTFSSLDLIKKEISGVLATSISIPREYLARHGVKANRLLYLLDKFKELKVCVVGDLIVDEYINCQPLGMSQEDPTIVVTPINSRRYIGGASIVAAHAKGLGAEAYFFSVVGNDDSHQFAVNELLKSGVSTYLITDETRPTTLKQRFRSKEKSLLRVSHLHQNSISPYLQNKLLEMLEAKINFANVVVFSDFNYGCLPQALVDKIIQKAKSRGVIIAADSQSSSQVGNISRFKDVDLITPTEREARISLRDQESGLVVLSEKLRIDSRAKNILLKLGEEGLMIHSDSYKSDDWVTDQIEALNRTPKDVAGAGDSLLICSALSLAAGGNIWEAACLGSLAAAVQVGRVGNIPIKQEEIINELNKI